MKFLFCGDMPVPEWFLSQLNLLSNLSFVKLRKIGGLYVTVLTDKEQSKASLDQIVEILTSSDFTELEAKTIIAMIDFIISNAAKNNVDQEQLMKELIDLGIPKENCQSLCKILEQNLEKLRNKFKSNVLRLNNFENVTIKKWSVLRSSSGVGKANSEYFQLGFSTSGNKIQDQPEKFTVCMEKTQLQRFNEDMLGIMKVLNGQTD